jgi:tRNA(Ile)-lysidine synthase
MDLLSRVRQFVRRHDLVRPGAQMLAAVSGGSDSVALAHVLRELAAAGDLRLVGLIHFNHQLRPTADDDERVVEALAASLGLPFLADRGDVPARARRERRSLEDAARAARYEFFERARVQTQADLVALGHTRDDQAETVLLRLLRGAGPRGLAGMYPHKGCVVRPLLGCRRRDLREWLAGRHVSFAEDESNQDVAIPRNRVRAELLPLLESRFNPSVVDTLADEAELARETWEWMEAEADALTTACTRLPDTGPTDGVMRRAFDRAGLLEAPRALARLVLWRAMTEVAGAKPVGFAHVTAALGLLSPDGPAVIDAPGQRAHRIGARIVLTGRRFDAVGRPLPDPTNFFRIPLSIPGEALVPQTGHTVSVSAAASDAPFDAGAILGTGPVAAVRRDRCLDGLAVRNRRPGDRFQPVGLGGQKKLQDVFVDRKVPRLSRDGVPLVVDASDRIVWVAGHGIDEGFRVTDPAQGVLILKLRQV